MKQKRIFVILLAAGLSICSHASLVTLNISGSGSGTLDGVAFTGKTFNWEIAYDTADAYQYSADIPIFLNLSTSQITLQDVASPINITQEHGFFTVTSGSFLMGPIRMTGTSPGGNILSISGAGLPAWDGASAYSQSGGISSQFNQFSGIATDQGTLTMNSGAVSSVVAAIPEPSVIALSVIFGGGMLFIRRRLMM